MKTTTHPYRMKILSPCNAKDTRAFGILPTSLRTNALTEILSEFASYNSPPLTTNLLFEVQNCQPYRNIAIIKLLFPEIFLCIILVEDLSADVIELLGLCLDIDPLFFAFHLFSARSEETTKKPRVSILPSRAKDQNFFNIHYICTLEFDDGGSETRFLCDANISRKLASFL